MTVTECAGVLQGAQASKAARSTLESQVRAKSHQERQEVHSVLRCARICSDVC